MGADLPRPPVEAHAVWADLALALAAFLVGVAWLRGQILRPAWSVLAPAFAYLSWFLVSAGTQDAPPAARFVWVLGVAALVALYATTAALTADDAVRDRVLRAWIAGACVLAVIGIVAGLLAQLGHRVPGLHRGEGELALPLRPAGLQRVGLLAELALAPFLLTVADGERLLGRRVRRVVLVVLALLLVLGVTRTVLAALVGLALLRLRSPAARALAVGVALALLVLGLRLDVHGTGEPGIRWRIAASALEAVRARPLFGMGPLGDVAKVGWPRAGDAPSGWDAHLTWLDISARAGVPATIAFLSLFVVLLRGLRRARRDALGDALYVCVWATLFDSLHVDVEDFRHVWLLFGICAGELGRLALVAGREAAAAPR